MTKSSAATPESIALAQELQEWHFAATAPGAQVERPEVIQKAMDKIYAEHPGIMAVEATKPTIPDEVKAEIDAFKAAHPSGDRTDDRHITLAHARGRGAL